MLFKDGGFTYLARAGDEHDLALRECSVDGSFDFTSDVHRKLQSFPASLLEFRPWEWKFGVKRQIFT